MQRYTVEKTLIFKGEGQGKELEKKRKNEKTRILYLEYKSGKKGEESMWLSGGKGGKMEKWENREKGVCDWAGEKEERWRSGKVGKREYVIERGKGGKMEKWECREKGVCDWAGERRKIYIEEKDENWIKWKRKERKKTQAE